MQHIQQIKEGIKDPVSSYRTAPLWVWNDDMTEREIRAQLQEMKAGGMGGAFVHPRPGLVTEYLSEEWFRMYEIALDEARKLNMHIYIYDENSYPSGFAGGRIPSELPDCVSRSAIQRIFEGVTADDLPYRIGHFLGRPGYPIAAYAFKRLNGIIHLVQNVTDMPVSEWDRYGDGIVAYEWQPAETNSWLGGFAYVDLLRPEVAQLFIETTHEEYFRRFGGDFGGLIPAVFTDEPEISPGNLFRMDEVAVPFSYWLNAEFERRTGYSLAEHLPALFQDVESSIGHIDCRKVRYDYYNVLRELWTDNFVKPLSQWCERHRIALTGHYLEHQWPIPWVRFSPAVMSLYEYMDWPAIDLLTCSVLEADGTNPLVITVREVLSAANQLGKRRTLCETYGAGGWDSTFADYKRIGDWLAVHGINFLNQHLTYSSIVGARKRDHPQSFDWREPWWEEYRTLNDYFGRVSYLLSQGKTEHRVLVLHPTTTAFLHAATPNWDASGLPLEPMVRRYVELVQYLCDHQIDFDFGDEYIMNNYASIREGRWIVGSARYEAVVLPYGMEQMNASTVRLLERYLQAGGELLALGDAPQYVDGKRSGEVQELAVKYERQWIRVDDPEALRNAIENRLVPYVRIRMDDGTERLPKGIAHMQRLLPGGERVHFVTNSGPDPVRFTATVKGRSYELWDLWSGDIGDKQCGKTEDAICGGIEASAGQDGTVTLPFRLEAHGSLCFVAYDERAAATPQSFEASAVIWDEAGELPYGKLQIERLSDNVWPLDYADVTIGAKQWRSIHTVQATHRIFQAHGFEVNPWDNAVQFKRRLLDRDRFPPDSGFRAEYRFPIEASAPPGRLRLAVERAAYCKLEVNGIPVSFAEGEYWMDRHIGIAHIADAVHSGDNAIRLTVSPFTIFAELEPVYLLGDFGLKPVDRGFVMTDSSPLVLRSWKGQGMPFYSDAVSYRCNVTVDSVSEGRLYVELPAWSGTVAAVVVNGRTVGLIGIGEGDELEITGMVQEGMNEIEVKVVGSLKNMLGPHHSAEKLRKIAGPAFWKNAPSEGPPPGERYDTIDYGLFHNFRVVRREGG